jgi:acetoin utilization deacetylase AcuC-like enzyme
LSIHRFGGGFYPGTGDANEIGEGKGQGATVNVPLHFNIAAKSYKEKFREAVEATADRVKPQLILLSAGFDAHRLDPIGGLGLEVEDFVEMTQLMLDLARTHTDGRLVSCLEGGYNWAALADCVTAHLETLLEYEQQAAKS